LGGDIGFEVDLSLGEGFSGALDFFGEMGDLALDPWSFVPSCFFHPSCHSFSHHFPQF